MSSTRIGYQRTWKMLYALTLGGKHIYVFPHCVHMWGIDGKGFKLFFQADGCFNDTPASPHLCVTIAPVSAWIPSHCLRHETWNTSCQPTPQLLISPLQIFHICTTDLFLPSRFCCDLQLSDSSNYFAILIFTVFDLLRLLTDPNNKMAEKNAEFLAQCLLSCSEKPSIDFKKVAEVLGISQGGAA